MAQFVLTVLVLALVTFSSADRRRSGNLQSHSHSWDGNLRSENLGGHSLVLDAGSLQHSSGSLQLDGSSWSGLQNAGQVLSLDSSSLQGWGGDSLQNGAQVVSLDSSSLQGLQGLQGWNGQSGQVLQNAPQVVSLDSSNLQGWGNQNLGWGNQNLGWNSQNLGWGSQNLGGNSYVVQSVPQQQAQVLSIAAPVRQEVRQVRVQQPAVQTVRVQQAPQVQTLRIQHAAPQPQVQYVLAQPQVQRQVYQTVALAQPQPQRIAYAAPQVVTARPTPRATTTTAAPVVSYISAQVARAPVQQRLDYGTKGRLF